MRRCCMLLIFAVACGMGAVSAAPAGATGLGGLPPVVDRVLDSGVPRASIAQARFRSYPTAAA